MASGAADALPRRSSPEAFQRS